MKLREKSLYYVKNWNTHLLHYVSRVKMTSTRRCNKNNKNKMFRNALLSKNASLSARRFEFVYLYFIKYIEAKLLKYCSNYSDFSLIIYKLLYTTILIRWETAQCMIHYLNWKKHFGAPVLSISNDLNLIKNLLGKCK